MANAPAIIDIDSMLAVQRNEIARVMGGATPAERAKRADRFCRIVTTAFRQTPKLAQCTKASFAGALMICAQLDLEPNTPQGLAYLIPYNDRKKGIMECQFQIGYKGLLQLAYRSNMLASINADVVYKREVEAGKFAYTKGITPTIRHEVDLLAPELRKYDPKDNPIIAAYASATLKGGQSLLRLVDAQEIERAKSSSAGARSSFSPWQTHPEAMCMKTAIKRLASWLPQTEQIALAVDADDKAERGESLEPERTAAERLTETFANASMDDMIAPPEPVEPALMSEGEQADLALDAELAAQAAPEYE